MIRKPIVAGQFYPYEPDVLRDYMEEYIPKGLKKTEVIGIMVPHAGYVFCGKVAGEVYGRIIIPDTAIIIGPNHTGMGDAFAVMNKGSWLTPFGEVPINEELANLILKEERLFTIDEYAHRFEHSIEVQLPFLQYLKKDFSFVPIVLAHTLYSKCELLGNGLARAIKSYGKPVLIIASSDMTHYESHEIAKKKDKLAIDKILSLNPNDLYDIVIAEHITMCGVIPTTVMLITAIALGAKKAELINYATSGDITGDLNQVVGYAGIIVK
ncbi:MAG: AmmeMemoRadiSam system protein B [Candidatus Desulfofervidus auxilii]|nr:AmmeMemoRadiSam system protein B [Candidatus Desulfofervidus auxilii]